MLSYRKHLTKDEKQVQFLLQVVSDHRSAACQDAGKKEHSKTNN